jgi:hypothetical protein
MEGRREERKKERKNTETMSEKARKGKEKFKMEMN